MKFGKIVFAIAIGMVLHDWIVGFERSIVEEIAFRRPDSPGLEFTNPGRYIKRRKENDSERPTDRKIGFGANDQEESK